MSAAPALRKTAVALASETAMHDLARLRAVADAPCSPADGVTLTRGSELTPQAVRWLWNGWLALGKLHILAGAPGHGKTTLALAMAATVTVGGRWPDATRCTAGNVLVWSGEDDPADTLLPRLLAMGADPARCYFVTGARINGEAVPFDPARDTPLLLEQAVRIGRIGLLIVDPVVSAVTGDSHKNTEVRRALQPLVDLASACDCAMLGITHFTKGSGGRDPTERVTGSIAFGAVARIVMVAAKVKVEDDKPVRVLARSKSNIGPDGGGFEYHLEQTEARPGIEAARIAWGKAVDGTARELLTDPDAPTDDEEEAAGARESAESFLRELLTAPTPSATVKKEAQAAGCAWRTVRRAADALGVIKRKDGMAAGWSWSLPTTRIARRTEDVHDGGQGVQAESLDKLDKIGPPSSAGQRAPYPAGDDEELL